MMDLKLLKNLNGGTTDALIDLLEIKKDCLYNSICISDYERSRVRLFVKELRDFIRQERPYFVSEYERDLGE
jgi:hypothetical protein